MLLLMATLRCSIQHNVRKSVKQTNQCHRNKTYGKLHLPPFSRASSGWICPRFEPIFRTFIKPALFPFLALGRPLSCSASHDLTPSDSTSKHVARRCSCHSDATADNAASDPARLFVAVRSLTRLEESSKKAAQAMRTSVSSASYPSRRLDVHTLHNVATLSH